MASHKQKRAKRMRRKHHQDTTSTGVRLETHVHNDQQVTIEVPRGPKPTKGYRREKGKSLDARELNIRELASLGITDPEEQTLREYAKLKRACGGSSKKAMDVLWERLKAQAQASLAAMERAEKAAREIAGLKPDQVLVTDEDGSTSVKDVEWKSSKVEVMDEATFAKTKAVDTIGKMRDDEVITKDLPAILAGRPTIEEWDDIVATAKKRKRSIKSFAEKEGYHLIEAVADAKVRENWVSA